MKESGGGARRGLGGHLPLALSVLTLPKALHHKSLIPHRHSPKQHLPMSASRKTKAASSAYHPVTDKSVGVCVCRCESY